MYKFFKVIFFSFFLASAMAAHQDDEARGQCYRQITEEIHTIYQRRLTVTYEDFERACSLNVFGLRRDIEDLLKIQRDLSGMAALNGETASSERSSMPDVISSQTPLEP